jgi:hypothetical protein
LTEIQAWIRGPGKNQTRSSIALHVVDWFEKFE